MNYCTWITRKKEDAVLDLTVCIGSACHLKGAYNLIQTFQQIIEEKSLHDKITLKSGFCMQLCHIPGVAVRVDGEEHHVAAEKAGEFFVKEVEPKLLNELY
jgi:NADH:ubiquinone oxidoreductase subunit E